ncbi:hypothetical protein T484DRAFT_1913285, partial [Baffinella frigidus]
SRRVFGTVPAAHHQPVEAGRGHLVPLGVPRRERDPLPTPHVPRADAPPPGDPTRHGQAVHRPRCPAHPPVRERERE